MTLTAKSTCLVVSLGYFAAMNIAGANEPLAPGQLNYMLQCQGCHKSNGEGIEGSVPDLKEYGAYLLSTAAGRQYFVSVPGSANAPLTNRELAEVLNFITTDILETSENEPESLQRFSEEEVARYRPIKIPDVERLRTELIGAIPDANTEVLATQE
jgi:mono/diheme cytochrome c family protein